jgi:hypothetical protein
MLVQGLAGIVGCTVSEADYGFFSDWAAAAVNYGDSFFVGRQFVDSICALGELLVGPHVIGNAFFKVCFGACISRVGRSQNGVCSVLERAHHVR